jgi:hypothetical protein
MKISAAVISRCSRKAPAVAPFPIQLSSREDGLNTVIAMTLKRFRLPRDAMRPSCAKSFASKIRERGERTGYRFRRMRSRAGPSKAAQSWLRLPRGIHRIQHHDCAWYVHLPCSGTTPRLLEWNYRHDAQSKRLRAVPEIGIRLMLSGNSYAGQKLRWDAMLYAAIFGARSAACRSASIRLRSSAMPLPAISKAVP